MFVFFKQKTAYEMRISDWSSDGALPISRSLRPNKLFPKKPLQPLFLPLTLLPSAGALIVCQSAKTDILTEGESLVKSGAENIPAVGTLCGGRTTRYARSGSVRGSKISPIPRTKPGLP